MTEKPPQGRITDKTPNECFNEIFPLLSMVLLAKELVNLARKYNMETLAVELDSEEAVRERSSQDEQTAQTMKLLKRVERCIKHYGAKEAVVGDTWALWRESVRREVVVSRESESAASFDLYIGPVEDFITRLHGKLRELLTEKLSEEPHTDVDRMHSMLLDCFA